MTLKVTLAVRNLYKSYKSEIIARIKYDVFTHDW